MISNNIKNINDNIKKEITNNINKVNQAKKSSK